MATWRSGHREHGNLLEKKLAWMATWRSGRREHCSFAAVSGDRAAVARTPQPCINHASTMPQPAD
ncbi:MAG: hypothetical protein EBT67_09225 [Betaproteobacteria bacterium]|nr:hypothetical protein [Betaproteobacteria bacterium]